MNKENVNMTIKDLKEIIKNISDDTPVIIPVGDVDDANDIIAFRYARTAGLLECNQENDKVVLCLNTSASGLDISEQIKNMRNDVNCKQVLF